jgi:hypothetical protein
MPHVGRSLQEIEKIWENLKVAFTTLPILSIFLAVGSEPKVRHDGTHG